MPSKVAPLQPLNINTPGVNGLTSRGSMTGDVGDWLLTAQNAVYDRDGKIAPRKLFRKLFATALPSTANIFATAMPDGRNFYVSSNDDIFYYATATFVSLKSMGNNGNAPGDMTNSYSWQAVSLNNKNYFFHPRFRAKVHDLTNNTFSEVPQAPSGGVAHSAFGRIWVGGGTAGAQTLHWSGLLLGDDWTGAGTGSLLLQQYMSRGETITAIRDFNDYLIVFTDRQILIFQDPFSVPVDSAGAVGTAATMTLKDRVDGVGCIGRKLVVSVGEELIFLGTNGLNKMSKVLSEGGSNPVSDLTLHIQEGLASHINVALSMTQALVAGLEMYEPELSWHPYHGFLFLNVISGALELPQYLIWLNRRVESGFCVTSWGGKQDTGGRLELIIGPQSGNDSPVIKGWVKTGLSENYTTDIGTLGAPYEVGYQGPFSYGDTFYAYSTSPHIEKYTFKMVSPWLSFGAQSEPFLKILKRALIAFRTASSAYTDGIYNGYIPSELTVTLKTRTDFDTSSRDVTFTAPLVNPGSQSVHSPMIPHRIASLPLAGAGSLVQYEISAEISNPSHETFSVQRLSFQAKIGRLHQGI